jgi:short subunit dehydrogenase-like uncharacterized protein
LNGAILIYGATGYTGKLIAKTAAEHRARPILAGRDLNRVKAIAKPLGLDARAFDLRDPARIDAAIKGVAVALNVAGPFSATSRPLADACLRNRVHYLGITGEIEVFETLAAHVKRRLPDANDLKLYLSFGANAPSRGTAKTVVEAIAAGTRLRRNGRVVSRDPAEAGSCDFGKARGARSRSAGATSRPRFIRPAFPTSRSSSRRRRRSWRSPARPGSSSRSSGSTSCKASSNSRSTGCRRGRAMPPGGPGGPWWLVRRATREVKRLARA